MKMGVTLKFELKQRKSLDFIAYSVFKDFDKKNFILRATLHPKMAINFERNYLKASTLPKYVIYVIYQKSKKI